MCKGVQHPVRGLFLRSYLHQMVKDRLLQPLASPLNASTDAGMGESDTFLSTVRGIGDSESNANPRAYSTATNRTANLSRR